MFTIKMVQAKKTMTKGTVFRWLKKVGDDIAKGDAVVQVESDAGLIEIASAIGGKLTKITVSEGQTVDVDTPIGEIDDTASPSTTTTTPTAKPSTAPAAKEAPVTATPTNVIPVLMPKAGQSVEEATIVKWHVAVGDQIKKDQVIFEIETDKATIEVEAPDAGRLARITVPEGEFVAVLEPVGYLADNDADVDAFLGGASAAAAPAPAPAPATNVAGPKGEVIPVLMPKAGQSVEEATIVKWHVAVGDQIKKDQVIFEIETDKATIEVEAPDAGRLARITVPEGEFVAVLDPVGYLADNDADVDAYLAVNSGTAAASESAPAAAPAQSAAPAKATAPAAPAVSSGGRVKASPAAKKIAADRGIDLATLPAGSGPGGRIISTNVPATAPAAAAAPQAAPAAPVIAPAPVVAEGEVVRKRMNAMRKAIARNLLASKQNIPHFYIKADIDAGAMYSFYKQEKAKYPCSVNDLVVMACAKAIQEFPAIRSQIDGEEIVEFPNSNIGIAVGLEGGLVVPVLLAAEQMSLQQIGSEVRRIAGAAKGGKIENMGKGVFTITNLGMFGVTEFSAIINPPEAAILAVGAIRDDVIVSGGSFRAGRKMSMTLSADHRIVDGMLAGQFMARVKEILECPSQLV